MAKRDPDKLPKGTENELRRLRERLRVLTSAGCYFSRYQLQALDKAIGYLSSHPIESGKA